MMSSYTARTSGLASAYSISPRVAMRLSEPILARMIVDDLPSGRTAADDERVSSRGVASSFFGALQGELAGDQDQSFRQRPHRDFGEGERAHGFGSWIGSPVAL